MTKKLIAFDLDDTLAVTKSPMSDQMSSLMTQLLERYEVCVISGGAFTQFQKQVIDRLAAPKELLARLHMMPTCGTRYYLHDAAKSTWAQQYSNDLSDDQKTRIMSALEQGAKELGLWEVQPYGDIIEDRGSQITFSALGQQAPADAKYAWDPTGDKKLSLRNYVAAAVTDVEVRVGGTTSVDITMPGVDKAYGMRELMARTGLAMSDILFIGDNLDEGGNDYPVKAMGIDTIAVEKWEDTALVVEALIKKA